MVPLASALVRAWTRLYTWGLPAVARDRRCAEIASDLWEFSRDLGDEGVGPTAAALRIVRRLLLGIPDDLTWRIDEGGAMSQVRTSIWLLVAALVVALLWPVIDVMRAQRLPIPPTPPGWSFRAGPPTRLPPPPPPPAPSAVFPNLYKHEAPPPKPPKK